MKKILGLFIVSGILLLLAQTGHALPSGFGNILGYINGVEVRYNGSNPSYVAPTPAYNSYVNGKYMGIKWQCVELARRYTYLKKGYLIPSISGKTGTAAQIWSNASALGLSKSDNGGTNRPRVGDMVFSTYGSTGHVGVISSAPSSISNTGTYSVTIGQQNWGTTSPTITRKLTVKKVNGVLRYNLEGFSSSYTIKGWAWR